MESLELPQTTSGKLFGRELGETITEWQAMGRIESIRDIYEDNIRYQKRITDLFVALQLAYITLLGVQETPEVLHARSEALKALRGPMTGRPPVEDEDAASGGLSLAELFQSMADPFLP